MQNKRGNNSSFLANSQVFVMRGFVVSLFDMFHCCHDILSLVTIIKFISRFSVTSRKRTWTQKYWDRKIGLKQKWTKQAISKNLRSCLCYNDFLVAMDCLLHLLEFILSFRKQEPHLLPYLPQWIVRSLKFNHLDDNISL